MRHKIKRRVRAIENIYRSSCFCAWEGISISSYLLINFWFTRIQANKSAIKALVVNRVGDMFLSIGFFAIFFVFGNLDYSTVFSIAPFINETIITIIGLLLLLAAMGKSAQLGLHTWLPDQPSFHFISNHLSIYKSARGSGMRL
jgi:NADH-ubiquinone oxidoreductase chain 5